MSKDWREDFKRLCRLTLALSVRERMRYGFIGTHEPVLGDAEWRSFDSMKQYRRWCQDNLPEYLGYGPCDNLDEKTINDLSAALAQSEIERRRHLPGYEGL